MGFVCTQKASLNTPRLGVYTNVLRNHDCRFKYVAFVTVYMSAAKPPPKLAMTSNEKRTAENNRQQLSSVLAKEATIVLNNILKYCTMQTKTAFLHFECKEAPCFNCKIYSSVGASPIAFNTSSLVYHEQHVNTVFPYSASILNWQQHSHRK